MEALSSPDPHNKQPLKQPGIKLASGDQPSFVNRDAASKSANQALEARRGKSNRLTVHIGIGFLMALTAVCGYAFFGPSTNASADPETGIVNIAPPPPDSTAFYSQAGSSGYVGTANINKDPLANDMMRIQAQMDEIISRMAALNNTNPAWGAEPQNNGSVSNLAELNQRMSHLHETMAKLNGTGGPMAGMGHH